MDQGERGGLICLYWTRNTKGSNTTLYIIVCVCVPLHFKIFWCGPTVFFSYVVAQNHNVEDKTEKMWASAAAVSYFGHA